MTRQTGLFAAPVARRLTIVALALSPAALLGCGEADRNLTQVSADMVNVDTAGPGHSAESEGYTLRANIAQGDSIPAAMRAKHGIDGGADRAILNLVILQQVARGEDVSVAADVTARQENLHGQIEDIEMLAFTSAGYTSYLGTFATGSQQNFRFTITAQPEGTDKTLVIEFEERIQSYE